MKNSEEDLNSRAARLTILGVPPPDYIGWISFMAGHEELFAEADIVCAGAKFLKNVEKFFARGQKFLPITGDMTKFYESLSFYIEENLSILILADGDPLFFGIGTSLARQFPECPQRIIPGISCLQRACARLRLPWHNMRSFSLHGRDDILDLRKLLACERPLCVLTGGKYGPDWLAAFMLDHGLTTYTMHIFENMDEPGEKYFSASPERVSMLFFKGAQTVILLPAAAGEAEKMPAAGLRGLYSTKMPTRAVILELLRLSDRHQVWDIGAGSGIMSLAISRNCALVCAVEEKPERAFDIQLNRRAFASANLRVILGHAPQCLAGLPTPDRIFVGGGLSGADGGELLAYCAARLRPGGILAASCVLLESFTLCRAFMENLAWPMEILQLQAACVEKFANGERLNSMNPVFLLAARKPEDAG